jgi:hypothetical protein
VTAEPTTHLTFHVEMDVADWIAYRIVHICDHLNMTFEDFAHIAIVQLAAQHQDI